MFCLLIANHPIHVQLDTQLQMAVWRISRTVPNFREIIKPVKHVFAIKNTCLSRYHRNEEVLLASIFDHIQFGVFRIVQATVCNGLF